MNERICQDLTKKYQILHMATRRHNRETVVNFKPSFTSVKYFMSGVNYDQLQTVR